MSMPPIVTPPDVQQPPIAGPGPIPDTGAPAGPAAPPKETFGQGFRRGAGGERYVVDAQGNVASARTTSQSGKGEFGSILAGAVMGALAGAGVARPGGIPSHELGGGAGQGAAAAREAAVAKDNRNRAIAQKNFENRQQATETKDKDLMYKAELHMSDLNALRLAHEIDQAQRDDPIKHEQLVNAAQLSQLMMESEAKNLGLINERSYKSYSEVPKADMDKLNRQQLKLVTMPDGSVKVWDRTFDARTTPNTSPFQIKSLKGLDPKTGQPEWTVEGDVKAGAATVAQQEAELDKERAQLLDAASKNATVEKEKAETKKAEAETALTNAQAKMLQSFGVNVPPGYQPPPDVFRKSPADLQQSITQGGATVPPDFQTLYAIGHYDAGMDLLTNNPRKGMPVRDKNSAETYIRTFINPNFDVNNFEAVKGLEKSFASGKDAQALDSFNAATGHLGQLYDIALQLKNGEVPAWNEIANELSRQTGKPVKPNYDAIKGVLVGEVGRLMKSAAPDVNEMAEISKTLSAASSPEQFAGAVSQYAHAMLTKGSENINRYVAYTGHLPPRTFSANTQAVFARLGIDLKSALPEGATVREGSTANPNPTQVNNQPKVSPAKQKALDMGMPPNGTPMVDQNGNILGYRLPDTPAGQMIPLGRK